MTIFVFTQWLDSGQCLMVVDHDFFMVICLIMVLQWFLMVTVIEVGLYLRILHPL